MIRPVKSNKFNDPEEQPKSLPEQLATLLAFVSVFIFFIKILFL